MVFDRVFERFHALIAVVGDLRQEHDAGAIIAGGRQAERHDGAVERIRHLDEDAGAVAVVGIRADRTTVRQVAEYLQAAADDVVAALALNVGEEADATVVVFVLRIVQALRRGEATGIKIIMRHISNL